jgi:hypothetical protein
MYNIKYRQTSLNLHNSVLPWTKLGSGIVLVITHHHGLSASRTWRSTSSLLPFTWEETRSIVSRLLLSVKSDSPDFKLGRKIIISTASCYHVSRITIKKVWQCALADFRNPAIHMPKINVKPAVKRLLCLAASCCSCFGNDAFTSIYISCPPRCRSFNML